MSAVRCAVRFTRVSTRFAPRVASVNLAQGFRSSATTIGGGNDLIGIIGKNKRTASTVPVRSSVPIFDYSLLLAYSGEVKQARLFGRVSQTLLKMNTRSPLGNSRIQSTKYSTKSLLELVQKQDSSKGDELAKIQKELNELKRTIALASKKNFTLDRDIRNLDKKIALLIKNRISLDQVIAESGDISLINQTTTLKDKSLREQYGKLFFLLQTETKYIAGLATIIKIAEIDNLLQTVMFTLYGNQYDENEENLLLSMFKKVLQHEFEECKVMAALLRANTALTRMMTTYTRRSPGQHYLKSTLTSVLTAITNDNELILEINPLKVYELMISDYEAKTGKISELPKKVTSEEAEENADVQRLIDQRIHKLGEITDNFVQALINSLPQIPYGIRWICKQIKVFMGKYFPESTRAQSCSMIGGFFLLRFINPAIVTPQAFMLVETKLSTMNRRNLTLFAKVMQNIGNNVEFGAVKEKYMSPLNVVLQRNRDKMNDFLDEMTNVEDFNPLSSGIDKYIALSKTDVTTINISLNEMYFIHALLRQNIDELVKDATDMDKIFKKLVQEIGNAPAQLPRKDNANVDLELDKSVKRGAEGEGACTADQIYAETKYLLFFVLKSIPNTANMENATIDDILEHATRHAKQKSIHTLHESVQRIRENCKVLVQEKLLTPEDDYALLRRDAAAELLNHDNLTKKAKSDLERLGEVLVSIQNHHSFLQEQFDTYKEYLGNVRQKSAITTSRGKDKKKSDDHKTKKKKEKPKGPFKYSHAQLEKDGVIMESEVPDDRRSAIFFVFSSNAPGVFDVVVMFGRRHIAKISVQLDDLLERQHNNQLVFETDFLKLNVNLLLYMLNRDFLS